jgi:hypothetical protein
VLIWVGYGHTQKLEIGVKMMALHLWDMTGEDRWANRYSVQGVVEPHGEYLVQLQPAAEGPTSTPADQLLTGADGQFELLVPEGEYILRLWRREGEVGEPCHITVTRSVEDLRIGW